MNQPLTHYSHCDFYKEVDDQDLCLDPLAPACIHQGQCCWECLELGNCDSACLAAAEYQDREYWKNFYRWCCR